MKRTMTVSELITALAEFDDDAPVLFHDLELNTIFVAEKASNANADIVLLHPGGVLSDDDTDAMLEMTEGEYAETVNR